MDPIGGDWLFWVSFGLALVWITCVVRLVGVMRERHPQKYEEMHLDSMYPRTLRGWFGHFNNARPVGALLRFLWKREYHQLDDPELTGLSRFMAVAGPLFLVLFALQFFGLVDAAKDTPARGGGLREEAFELHRQGRYADANKLYDRLAGESGEDADLLYWRGMARWKQARRDEALADLRRVIELDPAGFDAHHAADRILAELRRFDECLDLWNRYLAVAPGDARGVFERGGAHFRLRNYPAAQADAQKACDLGKNDACKVAADLKARLER